MSIKPVRPKRIVYDKNLKRFPTILITNKFHQKYFIDNWKDFSIIGCRMDDLREGSNQAWEDPYKYHEATNFVLNRLSYDLFDIYKKFKDLRVCPELTHFIKAVELNPMEPAIRWINIKYHFENGLYLIDFDKEHAEKLITNTNKINIII